MGFEGKMALIGAGPVGLSVAKALKHEGIPYDHFEADGAIGGNWLHGVYDTVHIVSSKKTTEFSDYAMPEDYPEFPSRRQMLDYLRAYVKEFGIDEGIQFDTKVVFVRPCEDSRWELTLESGERRVYKGVIVCNGHHWDRRYPNFPGHFTGETLHSKDYKSPAQLRGKRVLVIGGGNSGCDLASEAARVSGSAHISLRRGYWFMPKTMFGVPTVEAIRPWMPGWLQRLVLRFCILVIVGDYRKYGLQKPAHKIFEAHPSINSDLLSHLSHGRLTAHPDVTRLDGDEVEFADGRRESFDLIVYATGYHVSFPFLPEGLVEVRGAAPQLVAGGLHADYKNLYILGTLQLRYGFGPLLGPFAELLCKIIRLQDELSLPIGRVVQAVGYRVPDTHLVCPFKAMRAMRRARRLLPFVVLLERFLRRRTPEFQNAPAADRESPGKTAGASMDVF